MTKHGSIRSGARSTNSESRSGQAVRLATEGDLDSILELCRECFPKSPRWAAAGPFARNWLDHALRSEHAESVLCEADARLLGFAVLVVDETGWAAERTARCGSGLDYLRSMIRSPGLLPAELFRRVGRRTALVRPGPRRPPQDESRAWIELIGSSPRARRLGVGRALNDWCVQRTAALGRRRLELCVDPNNQGMRRFCSKLGYIHASQNKSGCIYSLTVPR